MFLTCLWPNVHEDCSRRQEQKQTTGCQQTGALMMVVISILDVFLCKAKYTADAPGMDYLPRVGEKWLHSKGNVAKYTLHGASGYMII